jgi:cytosine/adenosine deaminase-related metal-dependent hydrolase
MGGIVISNGRVVDPASGMDAVADVAVLDGRIAAIGTGLGDAERTIDATGLVVAPGFIDLHAHGQSIPADRMQAFDGVTTTLDLEAGVLPVASWYRRQADQGRLLNYGASTNWAFARIGAMTGSNEESSLEAFGRAMRDRRWVENVASETEVTGILDRLTQGLNEGGIGIGILNAYAPGAGVQELTAVCQLAAAHAVPTFTHIAYMSRIDPESAAEAYVRLIGYAGATGAHMHICHFNSSSKTDVERCAVLVAKAQAQGLGRQDRAGDWCAARNWRRHFSCAGRRGGRRRPHLARRRTSGRGGGRTHPRGRSPCTSHPRRCREACLT